MNVVCVLKTGGEYDATWVHALKRGLNRHLSDFLFYCLTDDPSVSPVWRIPLTHPWPGWWAKVNMLNPDVLSGPTLYIDLDTLVTGDLSDIASYDGDLAMLSDFYRPEKAQSGVMAFRAGPGTIAADLWDMFTADPDGHMRAYRGDGEWLHAHAPEPDRLQDLYPDQIVSLKVHAKVGPPENSRLVCAHGTPKMSDPAAGWAHRWWRQL